MMKKTVSFFFTLLAASIFLFQVNAFSDEISPQKRGDQFLRNHKPLEAVREYQIALQDHPESTAILFNLAIAYDSLGQTENTISTLTKLVELNGSDVEAAYNLGCLWLYKEDIEKAEFYFRKAETFIQKEPAFRESIAQGLELIGRLKKTDQSTQALLALTAKYALPMN